MPINSPCFNVTTTQSSIPVDKIFNSEGVLVVNNDIDNNIFYAENPSATKVLTVATEIVVTGVSGQKYLTADTSDIFEGDKLLINGTDIVEITAIVENTSFTVSGLTPAADDEVFTVPSKLVSGTKLKSSRYVANGLLVKHKDNTSLTEYQLTLVRIDSQSNVSPFFFKSE